MGDKIQQESHNLARLSTLSKIGYIRGITSRAFTCFASSHMKAHDHDANLGRNIEFRGLKRSLRSSKIGSSHLNLH